jgi:hypothetical protein
VSDPTAVDGVHETPGGTRGSDVPLRRFGDAPSSEVEQEPPAPERPLFVVVGTTCDDRHDWVAAGWALSDLLLTVERRGFAASPLTQVLELPSLRVLLRAGLGLVGYPQVVLRLGAPGSSGDRTRSGRRQVADVLT